MELLIGILLGLLLGGGIFFSLPRILPESMRQHRRIHFALGILFALICVRVGYEYYRQNSKTQEMEKIFETIRNEASGKPFLDAIERNDSEGYAKFRQDSINALVSGQGESDDKFYARTQKEVFSFWSGYFNKATPEAITGNIDAQIELLSDLKARNPDLACRIIFPLIFGPPALDVSQSPAYAGYLKSLEELIKSSKRQAPVQNEGAVKPAVFTANFRSRFPVAVQSLNQISEAKSNEQKQKLIEAVIVFMQELRKIDSVSAANIFRSSFKSAAN